MDSRRFWITASSCKHFQVIFTENAEYIQEEVLSCIPKLLSDEQNKSLQAIPTQDELKFVVFSMNAHLTVYLEGMNESSLVVVSFFGR